MLATCTLLLSRFSDFWDEIKAYHGMQQTSDIAVSTGWKSVDEFYRVSATVTCATAICASPITLPTAASQWHADGISWLCMQNLAECGALMRTCDLRRLCRGS